MRNFIFFAGFLLCGFSAHAEDVSQKTFCRLLQDYHQPAGVEYEPGVDVHGEYVAQADISGGPPPLRNFESIEIPVEIDLVQRFNLNPGAGVELKPIAALISIHNDGKVAYNGQDISKQAYELCDKEKKP
jgi:hypothetical protein